MNVNTNAIAFSLLIGLSLVAGAIYASGSGDGALDVRRDKGDAYVYGEKRAATTIVEFSDYECPFCSRIHPTLKRIVDESDGAINWEYRHLPLPSHRNAEYAAAVAECIGDEAGNEAFWEYTDRVFDEKRTDRAHLASLAEPYGLSSEELEACVSSPEVLKQIALDQETARAYGGSGTPFSIIVFEDGSIRPVTGALPYEQWAALLTK